MTEACAYIQVPLPFQCFLCCTLSQKSIDSKIPAKATVLPLFLVSSADADGIDLSDFVGVLTAAALRSSQYT